MQKSQVSDEIYASLQQKCAQLEAAHEEKAAQVANKVKLLADAQEQQQGLVRERKKVEFRPVWSM